MFAKFYSRKMENYNTFEPGSSLIVAGTSSNGGGRKGGFSRLVSFGPPKPKFFDALAIQKSGGNPIQARPLRFKKLKRALESRRGREWREKGQRERSLLLAGSSKKGNDSKKCPMRLDFGGKFLGSGRVGVQNEGFGFSSWGGVSVCFPSNS